jgi:tricarballylate dehydrogenase
MSEDTPDVIVVGAGLAGLSAALTARENGASVLVLECAPEDERGGNSRFSNGAMRAVYEGIKDVEYLVGEIGPDERARTDFGAYTREEYYDDMGRVTQYRADPMLTDLLVEQSRDAMIWLRRNGVKFFPLYQWQLRFPDGRIKFAGGSAVETYDGGEGLSNALFAAAEKAGIRVAYNTRAISLIERDGRAVGVVAKRGNKQVELTGRAVVLATGGFEANPEWRALPRRRLRTRQGARQPLQHRRRHRPRAARGRHAARQLVGLSLGKLGPQRARRERTCLRHGVQARRLHVRHHGQHPRRAFRR